MRLDWLPHSHVYKDRQEEELYCKREGRLEEIEARLSERGIGTSDYDLSDTIEIIEQPSKLINHCESIRQPKPKRNAY